MLFSFIVIVVIIFFVVNTRDRGCKNYIDTVARAHKEDFFVLKDLESTVK